MIDIINVQQILEICLQKNKPSYVQCSPYDQKFDLGKPEIFSSLKKINNIADSINIQLKYGTFSIQYRKNQILAEYRIKL